MKRVLWLPLAGAVLLGLGAVPVPTLEGCSLWAWAAETRSDGEAGRSQTITTTGESPSPTLALGRLPVDLGSVTRGTYARIPLSATRSLGDNAAEQSLSWQGQF